MARMVTSTGAPEFWAGAGEPHQPHASTASARMDECRYLIAAPQCPPGCKRGTHYRTTMTRALRRDARPIHPAASSVIHSPPTSDAARPALRRPPRPLGRPRARAFGLARGGGRGLRLRAALRPQPLRGEARPFGERVELCPHDALMHLV